MKTVGHDTQKKLVWLNYSLEIPQCGSLKERSKFLEDMDIPRNSRSRDSSAMRRSHKSTKALKKSSASSSTAQSHLRSKWIRAPQSSVFIFGIIDDDIVAHSCYHQLGNSESMPRISLSDGFDRSRRAHWSLDPSVSALALEFALAADLNQGELAGRLDHRALAAAAVQSLVDRLVDWSAS